MNASSSRHLRGGTAALCLTAVSLTAVSLSSVVSCSAGGAKANGATVGERPGDAPRAPGVAGSTGIDSLLPDQGPDFGADIAPPKGTFTGIPECEACTDFPLQPIFEDGLGPEVASAFSQASSGEPARAPKSLKS